MSIASVGSRDAAYSALLSSRLQAQGLCKVWGQAVDARAAVAGWAGHRACRRDWQGGHEVRGQGQRYGRFKCGGVEQ